MQNTDKPKILHKERLLILQALHLRLYPVLKSELITHLFNEIIKIAIALEIPISYIFTFDEYTYDIQDKLLLFLASEAFKDLDYKDREIAFKLVQCFKTKKILKNYSFDV